MRRESLADNQTGLDEAEMKADKEFKVENVSDFLDCLKWRFDETEGEERKRIGHQIIKIELALSSAGLSADNISVKSLPDGTLGVYSTNNDDIAVDSALLEDFNSSSALMKTVFVHEKTHQEGIHDEGLCQIRTAKAVKGAPFLYAGEQAAARRTFNKINVDKALSLYDIDDPSELIDFWLEAEMEKKYGKSELKRMAKSQRSLNHYANETAALFKERFKKGAPRLLEKSKSRGYSFKGRTKFFLGKMAESSIK